ncbi:MAG: quinone-dependent dihydroorotate dehydrogenase [Opitutales bacterium]|nr:quinone-dependent dihydroorotate dehydrogenase [Opitutales bacterium]
MGFYYEKVVRPVLFRLDPEKAHDLGVTALDYLGRMTGLCRLMERFNQPAHTRPIELFGLRFPNAVGLAAGMDKDAKFWRAAAALGFGHIEIGTVTRHRQPGNDRPRVFRIPEHGALINRMGFNNEGCEAVAKRLRATRRSRKGYIPVGINIGKSRIVPLDQAVDDYVESFNALVDFADYVSINVSSPNTPGLRELQGRDSLNSLLGELTRLNRSRARKLGHRPTPLLLKISPDLDFRQIDEILGVIADHEIDGVIATNTTIARPASLARVGESGGLSGRPLHARSVEVVNFISRSTGGKLPIIGVGGIFSPESAGAMVDVGAHLVQVYTGMVFRGPFIAKTLARALAPRHSEWI